jgi:hypothetical protein
MCRRSGPATEVRRTSSKSSVFESSARLNESLSGLWSKLKRREIDGISVVDRIAGVSSKVFAQTWVPCTVLSCLSVLVFLSLVPLRFTAALRLSLTGSLRRPSPVMVFVAVKWYPHDAVCGRVDVVIFKYPLRL